MGNNQPKYINHIDAVAVFGNKEWDLLKSKFECGNPNNAIDFRIFGSIIRSKFSGMPVDLIECLFLAFCNDLNGKIEIDAFLSTLTVLKIKGSIARRRFILKVYDKGRGGIRRRDFENTLQLVYDNTFQSHKKAISDALDTLFGTNDKDVSFKELEQKDIELGILENWIVTVLGVFLEPPPKKLLRQYRKLSALYDKQDEITDPESVTIPKEIFNSLKQQFSAMCGYTKKVLTLRQWRLAMKYSTGCPSNSTYYMLPQLSDWIFLARTESFRCIWRYYDFFQFCSVFGFKNEVEKAHYFIELLRNSFDKVFPYHDAKDHLLIINWISPEQMQRISPKYISILASFLFLVYCLSTDISSQLYAIDTVYKTKIDAEKEAGIEYYVQLAWKKLQKDALKAIQNSRDTLQQSKPALFEALTKLLQLIIDKGVSSIDDGKTLENEIWSQIELFLQSEMHSFHASVSRKYLLPSFPGIVDLKTTCNLRFLLPPLSAREEKECIMECILKHMSFAECASLRPHGKPGTRWAVIDKHWYDAWQIHVGSFQHQSEKGHHYEVFSSSDSDEENLKSPFPLKSPDKSRLEPISNVHLVASSSKSLRLIPDLVPGIDVELIPPAVFLALQKWYGGGPMIVRESVKIMELGNNGSIDGEFRQGANDSGDCTNTQGRFEVDLYPLSLTLVHWDADLGLRPSNKTTHSILISKHCVVDDVIEQLAIDLDKSTDSIRVYLLPQIPKRANVGSIRDVVDVLLQADGRTLHEWGVADESLLLLEKQNETDLSWPHSQSLEPIDSGTNPININNKNNGNGESISSISANSQTEDIKAVAYNSKRTLQKNLDIPKGLDNLGNTCYLNASLQALVHIPILTDYFTSGQYLSNLNTHNVMGYRGRLAVAFAKILGELLDKEVPLPDPEMIAAAVPIEENPTKTHSSAISSLSQSLNYISSSTTSYLHRLGSNVSGIPYSSVSPRDLHHCIGLLRDQFSGHEQHDAHELLMFLLDGLTEDMCFVSKKPYIAQPDSNDTPVTQLADIWWENHLKREKSFITSLCAGQFHSVLRCETCGFCSQRFEAFTVLPLPIPEDTTRDVTVNIQPWRLRNTTSVSVHCDRGETLIDALHLALTRFMKQLRENEQTITNVSDETSSVCQFTELLLSLSQNKDNNDRAASLNLWLCRYWIPAEVRDSSVRAFVGLQRKVDSIKDFSLLVFFNSMAPWRKTQYEKSFVSPLINDNESEVDRLQTLWVSAMTDTTDTEYSLFIDETWLFSSLSKPNVVHLNIEKNENKHDANDDKANYNNNDNLNENNGYEDEVSVRVAFQHRKAVFTEGVKRSMCGFDNFRLVAFAAPILEILPNIISGSALYKLASMRFSTFFRTSSAEELLQFINKSNRDIVGTNRGSRSTKSTLTEKEDFVHLDAFDENTLLPEIDKRSELFSISNDEIFAGPISSFGFTLRLISGGSDVGCTCSRCHWLSNCDGCVIPNNSSVNISLSDGESIAIDWHYVFAREMLDIDKLVSPGSMSVMGASSVSTKSSKYKVALSSCFDKFSERQSLTDVVCPGCTKKNAATPEVQVQPKLYQTIHLWRVPPLLIIQLKRFQFDRSSRRKLHTHVDCPLSNMNLLPFMSEEVQSRNTSIANHYRLVSVVHHVGVLGGGHYLNTSLQQDSWYLFNDHVVTKVKEPTEVVAPSAYLLFYLRNDMYEKTIDMFLESNNLLSNINSEKEIHGDIRYNATI